MSAYIYFVKTRVLESLAYRFEAISAALIQLILLLFNVYFWRAVYGTTGGAGQDVTLRQMLIYTTMSSVLSCFFSLTVEAKLRQRVRQGSVAMDFIKPINVFGMYLAEDIGGVAVNAVQKAFPLIIFSCVFVAVPAPASFFRFVLFLFSAALSFAILWLIVAIFGMINFWVFNSGNLGWVKDFTIRFLSGGVIPVWFFPDFMQRTLAFTPFIYIYQTPIAIYIGRTPIGEAGFALLIQLVWTAVFYALFAHIRNRGMGRIVVQGG